MLDFKRPDLSRKDEYKEIFHNFGERGCEYSLANLYMWGRQLVTTCRGCLVCFSHYHGRSVYPFPVGDGDVKGALDCLMIDAKERDIPFRVTCLTKENMEQLENWYPGEFIFRRERDNFDYVYDINDLADLKGRKYQQKRNHIHRFWDDRPDTRIVELSESTLDAARAMADYWYKERETTTPEIDYHMEKAAFRRGLKHFDAFEMEGILLMDGDEPLAVTMGSFLSDTIFDTHFEKARDDIRGAYAAVNQEMAKYLRSRHPQLQFINREDDLGIEGLRRAKTSYCPHHMVEKYWAHPKEEDYED